MSSQELALYCGDQSAAHQACLAGYSLAKILLADGKGVDVIVREAEDSRSLRANRFYWGYVLKTIAHQAKVAGQGYAAEAWHELFKRQFLGYEIEKVTIAGQKRKRVRRVLRSTADLKVKPFITYLEQIMAFAANDLNVFFQVEYSPQEVVHSKQRGMVIDNETGEIVSGL